jgi:hypothetical protein
MKNILFTLLLCVVARPMLGQGAPPQVAPDQPYTVEYYYKTPVGPSAGVPATLFEKPLPITEEDRRERTHTLG